VLHLQCNNNQLSDWKEVEQQLTKLPKLTCVYLEANPLAQDSAYRRKLKLIVPTLLQIDATLCR
jgi:protein phosphatase 1 regulatory subunit 7